MSTDPNTCDETTRRRAAVIDLHSDHAVYLSEFWVGLVRGAHRVVDSFFSDDRCFVVATQQHQGGTALEGRRLEILERILCGQGQKAVAIDLDLAPSTVALNARLGLEAIGVGTRASRVHPMLMLAAKAASDASTDIVAAVSNTSEAGHQLRIISVPRPDRQLQHLLPRAELEVVRSLVEGRCYKEIARDRGTSMRTIANQITAVFRRLRVSGRNELLHRLFTIDAAGSSPTSELKPPATGRRARSHQLNEQPCV